MASPLIALTIHVCVGAGNASAAKICQDDPLYVSPMGLHCSDYVELECDGFRSVGFSRDEADELIRRCPFSCKAAECEDVWQEGKAPASDPLQEKYQRKLLHPSESQLITGQDRSWRNRFSTQNHIKSVLTASCDPSWDFECQDDPYFQTKAGLHCQAMWGLDCKRFGDIGFTEDQVVEIINYCPCTCKVECGTWTATPSSKPSVSPTPFPTSPHPSYRPSIAPSSSPSVGPSSTPTMLPSFFRSSSPSVGPSSTPTMLPSFLPTYSPTASPTPAGIDMETTFVVPLEINSAQPFLNRGDTQLLEKAMMTFLGLNQSTTSPTGREGRSISIEISDVSVIEIIPREMMANGEHGRELKAPDSNMEDKDEEGDEQELNGGEREKTITALQINENIDLGNITMLREGSHIGQDETDELIMSSYSPKTEIVVRLRIACHISPFQPTAVDTSFQFVPRVLGGFPGYYGHLLGHLAKASATFTSPFDNDIVEEVLRVSPRSMTPPVMVENSTTSTQRNNSSSISNAAIVTAAVGSVAIAIYILSFTIVIRSRRHDAIYDGNGANEDGNVLNPIPRNIKPVIDFGLFKYTSPASPTNAHWRRQVIFQNQVRNAQRTPNTTVEHVFEDEHGQARNRNQVPILSVPVMKPWENSGVIIPEERQPIPPSHPRHEKSINRKQFRQTQLGQRIV